MTTIAIQIPENLYNNAKRLASEGWYHDEEEVILEAVRRFIEAHSPEILEQHIKEDVEWGLHGED